MATGERVSGLLRPAEISRVRLRLDAAQPAGTDVEILARTGGRHVPAEGDWTHGPRSRPASCRTACSRIAISSLGSMLSSGDGSATPVVREVKLEAENQAARRDQAPTTDFAFSRPSAVPSSKARCTSRTKIR